MNGPVPSEGDTLPSSIPASDPISTSMPRRDAIVRWMISPATTISGRVAQLLGLCFCVLVVVSVKAVFFVFRTSDYSRRTQKRGEAVRALISASDHCRPQLLDGFWRVKVTAEGAQEKAQLHRRILVEFTLGVAHFVRDWFASKTMTMDLSDENFSFVFTDTAYNNLFDATRRKRGEYVVDLSAYGTYEKEDGYHYYGCVGTFERTSGGVEGDERLELTSISVDGEVVQKGSPKWECAKLHLNVAATNEMLFNCHGCLHVNVMRLADLFLHDLPRTDPAFRLAEDSCRTIAALNEDIFDVLYRYASPLHPTALHVSALKAIHDHGFEDDFHADFHPTDEWFDDCSYQRFQRDAYRAIKRVVSEQLAEKRESYDTSDVHREFVKNVAAVYGTSSLDGLPVSTAVVLIVSKFLFDVVVLSSAEHIQVRRFGFYRTLLKTRKAFDDTPLTERTTQYRLDALQRVLFRTAFSGDHPTSYAESVGLLQPLVRVCRAYPRYIDTSKMPLSIDY